MWKMLKWSVIGGVVLLILSDIEISTSLYKYEDNSVQINFPRWQGATGTAWQANPSRHPCSEHETTLQCTRCTNERGQQMLASSFMLLG